MDESSQPRYTSNENEVKYRNCDDMLARRLAGNYPSYAHKTSDTSYKQFITPTGNPHKYVKVHKRNNKVNEAQHEKFENDKERDERNQRYEEMETLKQKLKDDEDLWSSKLDDWKARRRSLTFDVRQRKEDRESIMQLTSSSTNLRRRAKTYREIVEEKKKRDSGLYFSDDFTISNEENDYKTIFVDKTPDKTVVPNLKILYKEGENQDEAAVNGWESPEIKTDSYASPLHEVFVKETTQSSQAAVPVKSTKPFASLKSNDDSVGNGRTQTQLSAFSSQIERDHDVSNSRSGDDSSGQVTFESCSADNESSEPPILVANRRSVFENLAATRWKINPKRPARVDLSSLLKKDVSQLQTNGAFKDQTHIEAASSSQSSSDAGFDIPFEQVSATQERPQLEATHFEHKPKIMPANNTANRAFLPPSRSNPLHSKHNVELIHNHSNAAAARPPLAKSATLPSRLRIGSVEEKTEKLKAQNQADSLQLDFSGLGIGFSPRRSPRGGSGGFDSLFEDLDISITQRPKCEKGFGFTVRGGDDGRPVVVNQVSLGGAAELSNLRVGDEILAINGVRLSSSLTQDDIVQLIVQSVIKGNLLLGIRRYGKSKKVNTPRWLGTSLLGSPRGFTPRSDPSPLNFAKKATNKSPIQQSREFFPQSIYQPSSSKKSTQTTVTKPSFQRQAPLSAPSFPNEASAVQNGVSTGRESNIGLLLSNASRDGFTFLERDNQEREEDTRKRIEEARAEEQKIADELRKIELAKEQQKREQEERKRNLLFSTPSFLTNGVIDYGNKKHWLIEEAERSRLAEKPGKPRINIVEFTRENNPAFGRNHS